MNAMYGLFVKFQRSFEMAMRQVIWIKKKSNFERLLPPLECMNRLKCKRLEYGVWLETWFNGIVKWDFLKAT